MTEKEMHQALEAVFRPIHRVLLVVHSVWLGVLLVLVAVAAASAIAYS
jgi:hypothetical protein